MTGVPPENVTAVNAGEPVHVAATANAARVWYGDAAEAYAQGRADQREADARLADETGAVCPGDEGTSCYFSAVLRGQK